MLLEVLPIILLCISEILPFVHNHRANGILHFIVLFMKTMIAIEQQEQKQKEDEIKEKG